MYAIQTADLVLHFGSAVCAAEVLQRVNTLFAVFVGGVLCRMMLMMFVMMMLVAAVASLVVMMMLVAAAASLVVVMMLVAAVASFVVVMMMLVTAVTAGRVGMGMVMRVCFCMCVGVSDTFGRGCRHRGFVECHRNSLLIYI